MKLYLSDKGQTFLSYQIAVYFILKLFVVHNSHFPKILLFMYIWCLKLIDNLCTCAQCQ